MGKYLMGCTDNFCVPHHELSKANHQGCSSPPTMAAGLTDPVWCIREVLTDKLVTLLGLPLPHPSLHEDDPFLIPCWPGGPEFFSERGSYALSPVSVALPQALLL